MKKIALFSCHNDPNYGSMLQAYALVFALRKLGYDSEYINYSLGKDPKTPLGILKRIIKCPLRKFLDIAMPKKPKGEFGFYKTVDFAETMTAYERFHTRYIPVSAKKYYSDTVNRKFHVEDYCNYIVGSDQTWSPHQYHPQKLYFLDFCDFQKKNAYAPSLGTVELSDDYINILIDKLHSFDHLSCRELINSRRLSELLGREVMHVLDPTLLLTSEDWDKVAKQPSINENYILAYILGEKDRVIDFAERLGREKKLPVYYVVTRPRYLNMHNSLNGIGPDDWVGLIKNARYVVTDSYHGCLFSVNYKVSFYAFSKREGKINQLDNVRILEFLEMIGLKNRFQDENAALLLNDIDFSTIESKLQSLRVKSINYLSSCL